MQAHGEPAGASASPRLWFQSSCALFSERTQRTKKPDDKQPLGEIPAECNCAGQRPGSRLSGGHPRSGEVSRSRHSLREVGSRLAQQGTPGALLFKSPSQRGLLGRKLLAAFQTRAHPDHKAEEGMAVLLVGDDIISTDDPVRVLVVVSPERMLLIEEALV